MTAGRRRAATPALALAATLVLTATAAGARRASAPVPALASMALAPGDFAPAARVAVQETVSRGGKTMFVRVFRPGARLGGRPLLAAVSEVVLDANANGAAADFAQLRRQVRTSHGRQALGKTLASEFSSETKGKVDVTKTTVGTPVATGPDRLRLPVRMRTSVGTLHLAMAAVRVDRVIGVVWLAGLVGQSVAVRDGTRAAAAVEARIEAALTVADVAAPAITGSFAQGQTLTVDEGDWTGAPSGFTYAWERCDATGAACVPIGGATGRTYVPGPDDSGATLRVAVTGTNSVSSGRAESPPTPPIP